MALQPVTIPLTALLLLLPACGGSEASTHWRQTGDRLFHRIHGRVIYPDSWSLRSPALRVRLQVVDQRPLAEGQVHHTDYFVLGAADGSFRRPQPVAVEMPVDLLRSGAFEIHGEVEVRDLYHSYEPCSIKLGAWREQAASPLEIRLGAARPRMALRCTDAMGDEVAEFLVYSVGREGQRLPGQPWVEVRAEQGKPQMAIPRVSPFWLRVSARRGAQGRIVGPFDADDLPPVIDLRLPVAR